MSCWPPRPATAFLGLHGGHVTARDYYEASRPTHDRPSTLNGQSSRLDPAGCRVETDGPAGWFPPSPDHRSVASEAFFSSLQHEVLSRHHFRTRADARAVVVPWSQDFHNVKRRHSSAALLAPDEYERIPAIQPDAA